MTETAEAARAIRWAHAQAVAPDGRKVGEVVGLVVDRQSGSPQWLLLHHRFHGNRCVPLTGVIGREGRVHVPYDAATVLHSEPVPEDGSLSARHEQHLCAVYGVAPTRGAGLSKWERRRTTSLARLDGDGTMRWEPPPRAPLDPGAEGHATPVGTGGSTQGAPSVLRVLIADSNATAGQALALEIEHHPRLELAGIRRDGPQAITAALAEPPDVLVLSAQMTLLSGLEVRDRLHAVLPDVVTVLLDDAPDSAVRTLDDRTVRAPARSGGGGSWASSRSSR
jgi:CheY-like chemotaxis protein